MSGKSPYSAPTRNSVICPKIEGEKYAFRYGLRGVNVRNTQSLNYSTNAAETVRNTFRRRNAIATESVRGNCGRKKTPKTDFR